MLRLRTYLLGSEGFCFRLGFRRTIMITLSKLAIAGAVAAFAIASPAFGQSFDPTAGTGNVLPYAYNGSGATGTSPTPGRVARAASGLNAYAMIRHEGHGVVQPRALYDYGF